MKNDLSMLIPVISSQKHLDEILLKNPSLLFMDVKICCSSKVLFELKDKLPSTSLNALIKKCEDEEVLEKLAKIASNDSKVTVFENVNTPFELRLKLLARVTSGNWRADFRSLDKKFFTDLKVFFETWEEQDVSLVKNTALLLEEVPSIGVFNAFFQQLFENETLMKQLLELTPSLIRFCQEDSLTMLEAPKALNGSLNFFTVLSKIKEIDFPFLIKLLKGTRFSSFTEPKTLRHVHKLKFLTRDDLDKLHDESYSSYIFILLLMAENSNLCENDLSKICKRNLPPQVFETLLYTYAVSNHFSLETFRKLQKIEVYTDSEIFRVLVNESRGVLNDKVFTLALNLNFSLSSTLKNTMGKHPKFNEHKSLFLDTLLEKFYESLTSPNAFEISLSLLETWEGSLADLAVVCNEV